MKHFGENDSFMADQGFLMMADRGFLMMADRGFLIFDYFEMIGA